MSDTATLSLAELHWSKHYGLHATFAGEDGHAVIYGHHDDRRTVAALTRLWRVDIGEPLLGTYQDVAGSLDRRWGRFITECLRSTDPGHGEEGCWQCDEIRYSDWWLAWGPPRAAGGITADTEGAFPITMWGP